MEQQDKINKLQKVLDNENLSPKHQEVIKNAIELIRLGARLEVAEVLKNVTRFEK